MNLEEQQKIQNTYFELIQIDSKIQGAKNFQDTCIKSIPVSTCRNAIRMTARAIDRQIIINSLNADKAKLLNQLGTELRKLQRND